tara:strand:+ start:194 stop:355 length:162 start_codon:yes stop_codon:yes gene_type:complete
MSIEMVLLIVAVAIQFLNNRRIDKKLEELEDRTILTIRNPVMARRSLLRKEKK